MAAGTIIPGLQDAVAAERFQRNADFLDLPEKICGVPVRPLTVRDVVKLDTIDSPFIAGGRPPNVDDITNFLWLLSPGYEPSRLAKRWFFLRRLRRLDYREIVPAICDFVHRTFEDSPGGGAGGKSYYSIGAALVGIIASEYGWSEAAILDLPVRRALQYRNEITQRKYPKAVLFNPSDSIIGGWLNARAKN
jgi:hypothetical protein